jgi:hypothetical protein
MLEIVCWRWRPPAGYRSTFSAETVNTLKRMIDRHYTDPHRLTCITDDPEGIDPSVRVIPLWSDHANVPNPGGPRNPSCYRRLKLFSAEARELIGARLLSIDLDIVVTGDMRPVWNRPEEFVINSDTGAPRTPYNGSMFLLTAGSRTKVWDEFNPTFSPKRTRSLGMIGSDQAWIACALGPNEARWTTADGIYSYRKHLANQQDVVRPDVALPADARLINFHGRFDPWSPEIQQAHAWVREHYQ